MLLGNGYSKYVLYKCICEFFNRTFTTKSLLSNKKIGKNFRCKDKQPLLMKSGIVYKLTCSCGSTYIGQTRRNLLSKIEEHATSEKSEVCKHLLQNPTHCVEFNTSMILGSENDTARLLILWSHCLSKEQTLDLNNDSQSCPLMIFNT